MNPESNVVFLSNHEAIRAACATVLGGVVLTDINEDDNSRIYQFMDAVDTFQAYPCVVCTFEGTQEAIEPNSFESDNIDYPVNIWFFDKNAPHWQQNTPKYLNWRRTAMAAFRPLTSLPEVPDCYNVTVHPRIIVDPALLDSAYQYLATGFQVVASCSESRAHDTGSST